MITILKSKKSGFTIVEIMVVMAIMAMMSVLGILAMVGINNGVIADRAAESILNQIREAQNKAFSVASVKDATTGQTIYPVAWGVTVTKSQDGQGVSSFYIQEIGKTDKFVLTKMAGETAIASYSVDSLIPEDTGTNPDSVSLIYTAPFGGYFASTKDQTNLCQTDDAAYCSTLDVIPYDFRYASAGNANSIKAKIDINISFRGSTKAITVENNGQAGISE